MASLCGFRSVCVFCGSSLGFRSEYREAAAGVGRLLAIRGSELIYGGGHVGLMGAVADAALNAGGRVIGVMPRQLIEREIGHNGLTEMRIVETMHERKAMMADLSEAFIALPGGHGTLDEFCEILTWAQLGIHTKPYGILNVSGYYDPLLAMFDRAVQEGFLKAIHRDTLAIESDPERLLTKMERNPIISISKWDNAAVGVPVP